MPKAATRSRKKVNFDEEDSHFVPEVPTPRNLKEKATDRKVVTKEYTKPSEFRSSKNVDVDDEEEEIPVEAPPPKKKTLVADAMPKKSAPKPSAPKKHVAPKSTTKDIPTATKEKGTSSSAFAAEDEDEDAPILMKLRPRLPLHNESHPIVEDMKKRRDALLRKWRAN
ncbi:hypothetical protein ZWY2020_058183 [Hordeum vulgare]|nr:hypothetical protein ZWY2020_058183 [Hordeum vulgare]